MRNHLTPGQADAYLARIGCTREAPLATLQESHLRTVPFEDYDIHLGVPISLELEDLFFKIVVRRRGGFCYELNGLFSALLEALGHSVVKVSGFGLDEQGGRKPDFEHLRLLVDGQWIADAGNGAAWSHPLPFRTGRYGDVEVSHANDLWWTTIHRPGRDNEIEWAWTPQPRGLEEFEPRCRYQEHDPGSHFVARRLAVLPLANGRLSLVNGVLSETGKPDRTLDADEEREVLRSRFGIVLPADASWSLLAAAAAEAG
jgi:N-hydroxyarylamine O-acetyltransferase